MSKKLSLADAKAAMKRRSKEPSFALLLESVEEFSETHALVSLMDGDASDANGYCLVVLKEHVIEI